MAEASHDKAIQKSIHLKSDNSQGKAGEIRLSIYYQKLIWSSKEMHFPCHISINDYRQYTTAYGLYLLTWQKRTCQKLALKWVIQALCIYPDFLETSKFRI